MSSAFTFNAASSANDLLYEQIECDYIIHAIAFVKLAGDQILKDAIPLLEKDGLSAGYILPHSTTETSNSFQYETFCQATVGAMIFAAINQNNTDMKHGKSDGEIRNEAQGLFSNIWSMALEIVEAEKRKLSGVPFHEYRLAVPIDNKNGGETIYQHRTYKIQFRDAPNLAMAQTSQFAATDLASALIN